MVSIFGMPRVFGAPMGTLHGGAPTLDVSTFNQSVSGVNILTNGDFETGDPPTGWIARNNAVLDADADVRPGTTGVQSLEVIRGDTAAPNAERFITTVVGQWYVFDGWLKRGDSSHCYGRALDAFTPPSPFYQATEWGRAERFFRASGTLTSVRFFLVSGTPAQYSLFDDWRLRAATLSTQQTLPSANAEIEIELNLPSVDTYIGQSLEIAYRISGTLVSEANYWMVRLARNNVNDNWNVALVSVASGTETSRDTLDDIGTPEKLIIRCYGTQHQVFMDIGGVETPVTDVVNVSHNNTATGVNVIYGDNMTPVRLIARPSSPFDSGLSGTSIAFIDGDSKSDPTASFGEWPFMFKYVAEQRTRTNFTLYNVADAGDTLAEGLAALPTSLAALDDTPEPLFALINYGANDVQSLPAEAVWKQDLRDYIETLHAKWASTPIYIMQSWRQAEDADCDTLAGWITDVVGEYAYAFVGGDERDFLKGNDDGAATMLKPYPTAHANGYGSRLTALVWADLVL